MILPLLDLKPLQLKNYWWRIWIFVDIFTYNSILKKESATVKIFNSNGLVKTFTNSRDYDSNENWQVFKYIVNQEENSYDIQQLY